MSNVSVNLTFNLDDPEDRKRLDNVIALNNVSKSEVTAEPKQFVNPLTILNDSVQEFIQNENKYWTEDSIKRDILNFMRILKDKGFDSWISEKKLYDSLKRAGKMYSRSDFNSAIFGLRDSDKIENGMSGPMYMYTVYRPR